MKHLTLMYVKLLFFLFLLKKLKSRHFAVEIYLLCHLFKFVAQPSGEPLHSFIMLLKFRVDGF